MKRVGIGIAIVFVVIVVRSLLDDDGVERDGSTDEPGPAKLDAFAARGIDNTWPVLDDTAVALDANLAARNYYLIVDGSGSMEGTGCSNGEEKLAVAQRALQAFVERVPEDANLGLYVFDDEHMAELVALGTASRGAVQQAIAAVVPGGGTPLSAAIEEGVDALSHQAEVQLGYGEYHLVVVTDGEASSGYSPERVVARLLTRTPIVMHTIGFCIDDDHSLNQPGFTIYKAANDPASLREGLDAVLAEADAFVVTEFADP